MRLLRFTRNDTDVMLKFFFNRHGIMVRLMEALGVLGLAAILWKLIAGELPPLQSFLFIGILIQYLFLRFCAFRRWCPDAINAPSPPATKTSAGKPPSPHPPLLRWRTSGGEGKLQQGIGLQFEKAMVPAGYILAITAFAFLASKSPVILAVAFILLAVVTHVNIILIYLHFRDRRNEFS